MKPIKIKKVTKEQALGLMRKAIEDTPTKSYTGRFEPNSCLYALDIDQLVTMLNKLVIALNTTIEKHTEERSQISDTSNITICRPGK